MHTSRRALARLARFTPILLVAAVAGCSILRQAEPTPAPQPPVTLTAEQAARAMQEDHFFSDYRGDTLLVQGTVSSVEQKSGETLIRLGTGLPADVVCDVGIGLSAAKAGDTVTVAARADDAQRSPGSVLLKPCEVH